MSHSPQHAKSVLFADGGRHITIGRHTGPSFEGIDLAAEGLKQNGVGGRLAVTERRYYSRGQLSLMMVHEISPPRSAWDEVVANFLKIRVKLPPRCRPLRKHVESVCRSSDCVLLANSSSEEKIMRKPIEHYMDAAALRGIMVNAKRLNDDEIWRRAFRRLCALQGIDQTDPLHRAFYETLAAYEQLLTDKNNRTTIASRTRQKLKNRGIVQCLEDWAVSKAPTEGFALLVSNGLVELTGEYLVLQYPDRFSANAVKAARVRLSDAGVDSLPT